MDWKKLYLLLFNRMTDAIRQLERRNYGEAEALLRDAQREAETLYIEENRET